MKYFIWATTALSIGFVSSRSLADYYFIQNELIYSVQSKYSPEKTTLDKAKFLKIGLKLDKKNGTTSYLPGKVVPLGVFTLEKAPIAPKVIPGEGCRENPMTWLKTSKVIGRLKQKEPAMFVQVPAEITSVGKASATCPGEDRFASSNPSFAIGEKNFAAFVCDDDLNSTLLIQNSKIIEAELVITENCP
jgi:hypothetical protein